MVNTVSVMFAGRVVSLVRLEPGESRGVFFSDRPCFDLFLASEPKTCLLPSPVSRNQASAFSQSTRQTLPTQLLLN